MHIPDKRSVLQLRSAIVLVILVFAVLGLLLGFADSLHNEAIAPILTLTTDKSQYKEGEEVTFTATNEGDRRLLFSYGSLQLNLENLDNHRKYRVISGQAYNSLEPGQSKTIVWNENRDGKLDPGIYVARISTSQVDPPVTRVETQFRVS